MFYEITISNNDAEYLFNDNILIITPNLNFNGEILISINVTDTELSDFDQFIINVTSINDPPMITSTPVSNILIGEIFEYIIEVEDPDSDTFIFEIQGEPEGMSLNESGMILWTPDYSGYFGPIIISVTENSSITLFISLVFLSSFEKPRSLHRPDLNSSPSMTSTLYPFAFSLFSTARARVVLPAPESPVICINTSVVLVPLLISIA